MPILQQFVCKKLFLTADNTIKHNYTTYCKLAVEVNGTPHGGVALLVKNGIPRSQISLNTSLQPSLYVLLFTE